MQYYTKQQLQGSVRYGGGTLVGNWSEDRSIKETVVADFLAKADAGSLKIDKCAPGLGVKTAIAEGQQPKRRSGGPSSPVYRPDANLVLLQDVSVSRR